MAGALPIRRIGSYAVLLTEDSDTEEGGPRLVVPKQISFESCSPDYCFSFGSSCQQGKSSKMEDRVVVEELTSHPPFKDHYRVVAMGVFDGHAGHEAADHLAAHFVPRLLACPLLETKSYGDALRETLMVCEAEFMDSHCTSGSTALVALMVDEALFLANVGDCRAVVSDDAEARPLTRDHKPTANALEKKRLLDAGAQLSSDGYVQINIPTTASDGTGDVEITDIALSRALGGAHIKKSQSELGALRASLNGAAGSSTPASPVVSTTANGEQPSAADGPAAHSNTSCTSDGEGPLTRPRTKSLVIADPEVFHYAIHQDSEFLILASDGIWDKIRNTEACNVVRRSLNLGETPSEAAQKLADHAIKLASHDNVTVVVLRFSSRPLAAPALGNSALRRARSYAVVGASGSGPGLASIGSAPVVTVGGACAGGALSAPQVPDLVPRAAVPSTLGPASSGSPAAPRQLPPRLQACASGSMLSGRSTSSPTGSPSLPPRCPSQSLSIGADADGSDRQGAAAAAGSMASRANLCAAASASPAGKPPPSPGRLVPPKLVPPSQHHGQPHHSNGHSAPPTSILSGH